MFLVLLCNSKPTIPVTNTSSRSKQFILTDKHYWERSLIHSAKRCGDMSSAGVICSELFLLCALLNYIIL